MNDTQYREFLQYVMPLLKLRWAGFRNVRKQVYTRLHDRFAALGLADINQYRTYLDTHEEEWHALDFMCRITISRFYRDRDVFDALGTRILPSLVRQLRTVGKRQIACWSAGCCCGEEPYTMQIIWRLGVMHGMDDPVCLNIVATDMDEDVLMRAHTGCYSASSLKELPAEFISPAFTRQGDCFCIKDAFRKNIAFVKQDVRMDMPDGPFHIILCRNLVLTYYDADLQAEILNKMLHRLERGGYLVTGKHESLPKSLTDLVPYERIPGMYVRSRL
jgi:chemotaxis protein methyltransferase CheR